MKYTGIKATPEETAKAVELATRASNTPVIALSVAHGIERGGFAGEAWHDAQTYCHAMALKHGLPEIPGFYGMTKDGEFVQM